MELSRIKKYSVKRSKLWFGRYRYSGHTQLRLAHALRELDHAVIDRMFSRQQRWQEVKVNYGGSWHTHADTPLDKQQDLHDMCDFLLGGGDCKTLVQGNRISVYTNDHAFLERLARFPVGQFIKMCEIELQGDPDSVNLRASKHQWRSYFRTQKIDAGTMESLRGYLYNQKEIRISPSLKHALDHGFAGLHEHHFIDHDSAAIINMMLLISPRLIRKTLPIKVHK